MSRRSAWQPETDPAPSDRFPMALAGIDAVVLADDEGPGTVGYAAARGHSVMLCLVAGRHNVTPADIMSSTRRKSAASARHEFAYELRKMRLSWLDIGLVLGRHSTSALYAARAHAAKSGVPYE